MGKPTISMAMFNSELLVYQRVPKFSLVKSMVKSPLLGGFNLPLWKMMDFVNGKDDIPYMKWKIQNVWNHQPGWNFPLYGKPSILGVHIYGNPQMDWFQGISFPGTRLTLLTFTYSLGRLDQFSGSAKDIGRVQTFSCQISKPNFGHPKHMGCSV